MDFSLCFTQRIMCVCHTERIKGSMCLCTWQKVLSANASVTAFIYLFLLVHVISARPCSWHGVSTAVSPFPRVGFDIQNAIQTLPGDYPMKWTGSKAPAPPLAPKQEGMVYQARLTPDSFIIPDVPRWLDYDVLERSGEQQRKMDGIKHKLRDKKKRDRSYTFCKECVFHGSPFL